MDLAQIPPDKMPAMLARLEAIKHQRVVENQLASYKPYARQAAFHEAGALHRERLLIAANQSGKSLAGGMETAMHATGRYPDWWQGRRFDKPTVGWVAGTTNETTRDTVQRILVGRPGKPGTGSIPKDAILELVSARGTPDLLDSIKVRHVSGGLSVIGLKSYQRGRESFQGETLDYLWFDEEPPADIYSEGLTRTNVSGGPVWLTFTPLLGMSETVRRFLLEKSPDRSVTTMTLDDVAHYSAEEKAKIAASYAAHEREARTKGIPALGSGRIFPVPEETLAIEHRQFPSHWPRIGSMDFGWDHPFAAVELVWDRDTDTVYVSKTYRIRQATPVVHAAALKPWGLRWAWPRDGRRETLEGAGEPLARQYRDLGLDLMYEHAQFTDGSVSLEAGLHDILIRMEAGRFKVFKHLNDWWDEFRLYHRRDGKVVKEYDDLMSATRYGIMMLRTARTKKEREDFWRPLRYPKRGCVYATLSRHLSICFQGMPEV
jgi:phage terminase large subunit-like protein